MAISLDQQRVAEIGRATREAGNGGVKATSFAEVKGSGAIPAIELNPLAQGDVFTVMQPMNIFEVPVGRPDENGKRNTGVFVLVEATTPAQGETPEQINVKRLWISSLTRSAQDMTQQSRTLPSGNINQLLETSADYDDFFTKLGAKKVKVSAIHRLNVKYPSNPQPQKVNVYDFDVVE